MTAASLAVPGQPTPVVIAALNASNQVVPTYTGTITFSSSDMNASISPYPALSPVVFPLNGFKYTFGSSDNGKHLFYITFSTGGKQTLTVTDGVVTQTATIYVASTFLPPTNFFWMATFSTNDRLVTY